MQDASPAGLPRDFSQNLGVDPLRCSRDDELGGGFKIERFVSQYISL
jgi:hypothetical protein